MRLRRFFRIDGTAAISITDYALPHLHAHHIAVGVIARRRPRNASCHRRLAYPGRAVVRCVAWRGPARPPRTPSAGPRSNPHPRNGRSAGIAERQARRSGYWAGTERNLTAMISGLRGLVTLPKNGGATLFPRGEHAQTEPIKNLLLAPTGWGHLRSLSTHSE